MLDHHNHGQFGSRKRILNSTEPIKFDDSQPTWVKLSLVKKKIAADDDCLQANRMDGMSSDGGNRNARFSQEWGWLFGYATICENNSESLTLTASKNIDDSRGELLNSNAKSVSSPFGPVKLRKTHARGMQNGNGSPTNSSRRRLQQPRTILIQDSWNTVYNGTVIDVTGKEAAECVVQANTIQSDSKGSPKNLIELTHLHEPSLIQSLRERYDEGNCYTFCGKILLALNPFKEIPGLYGDERMKQCWEHGASHDDTSSQPHAYAIAHEAFAAMKRAFDSIDPSSRNGNTRARNNDITVDQSILISGESGAGKTVTTKIVMQYLAKLSEHSVSNKPEQNNPNSKSMEEQVLQSNPILESFGNARTVRNDNSSRFGKFIEIQFDRSGRLVGASIKTYLLEKVRLIRQAEGERNFHIFYEILCGLELRTTERKELCLHGFGIHDFRITSESGTFDRRDGIKDCITFSALRSAMNTVGFLENEIMGVFQVISGLLHMSNLSFLETTGDSVIVDDSNKSLEYVLRIFGVDLKSITNALCTSTITVGSEVVTKNLSLDKVEKAVEALMKATYDALFDYIVGRLNSSITVEETKGEHNVGDNNSAHIKILDIFGFESFETNSFEQLCINYANESLQQQFNRHIFKLEQLEYEKEGIAWSFISFPDNQNILDLIEKKHSGIFSILDEQCRLAKCTDQSFVNTAYEKCTPPFSANRTQQARGLFSIQHYAGEVEYNAESFLDKNKDELPKETTEFLLSSTTPFFVELGKLLNEKSVCSSRKVQRSSALTRSSVGSQFSSQLRDLRENIDKTAPHYIRCLKPNDKLIPDNFVPSIIADQLRCAGVLEAVRVSRIGYPQRYSKDMFVQRYGVLSSKALRRLKRVRIQDVCENLVDDVIPQLWERQNRKGNVNESCSPNILHQRATFDLVSVGVQLGKTKVFLRHHAFESLEYLRGRKVYRSATCLQAMFRMHHYRAKYKNLIVSTLKIQCNTRCFLAKRETRRRRADRSAIVIQSAWRGFAAYSIYSIKLFAILSLQRLYRGNAVRKIVKHLQFEKSATIIQSYWRMTTERNKYLVKQYIALNLQQCFRKIQAKSILKELRKEAKDFSRVAKERDEWRKRTEEMKKKLEEAHRIVEQVKCNGTESKNNGCEISSDCSDSFKLQRWIEKYNEMEVECRAKNEEILCLQRQVQTLQTELDQCRSTIPNNGSQPASLRFPSRSVVSDSIGSSRRLLDASIQSLKWGNGSQRTHHTEFEDSSSPSCFDTPIHSAIRAADDDALSVAVTNCEDVAGDINRGGRDGRTPLHLAILSKNLSSAEFLLQNDSVANTQDDDGNTPLHYAKSSAFVELLLDVGRANPNIPNEAGFCAIHVAVQRRDVESVKCLLSHSANVNVADDAKWLTPLHLVSQETLYDTRLNERLAQETRNLPVVEIARLICSATKPNAADVDFQDKDGNTPLHHATVLRSRVAGDLVSLLLKKNASPNVKNNRGQTPMHLLMHNENLRRFDFFPDLIQLMLYQGCDTNVQSLNGCTALHLAIYHRDFNSAVELLERGAQLHLTWQKPLRWEKHWSATGSSNDVYALEMIEDEKVMRRLFTSITCGQELAPTRSNCMQCKRKIVAFGKKNCLHCGSLVCSRCSSQKLDKSFFPPYCQGIIGGDGSFRVCLICEDILTSRKYEQENMMGREVLVRRQDEVSMLDMETSFLCNSDMETSRE